MFNDTTKVRRCEDAIYISGGACNPVAVANTIARHTLAMSHNGADHPKITNDAALQLMVHQLAFLMHWRMDEPFGQYAASHRYCELVVNDAKAPMPADG